MTRVVWTPQAVADLEAIHSFIARDSQRYAEVVVDRLLSAVDRLEDFPRSGRVVPELQHEDLREVLLGAYRLVYHLVEDRAEIITVFHSSRLLGPDIGGGAA